MNRQYIRKEVREARERAQIVEDTKELLRGERYLEAQVSLARLKAHGGPLRSHEWVSVQEVVEGAKTWMF